MLTALSTGHDGSLCTVHAGSPTEALRRIEVLALMSDVGLPHAAIREQVADAFDLVVCQARCADGSRRVVVGRRGRARRRRPGGARALRVARRRAALARRARRGPRRAARGRRVMRGGVGGCARRGEWSLPPSARRREPARRLACGGGRLVAGRGTCRRRLEAGRVMAVALAFAAAAAAVVGVWELLAAVERTRVAALLARLVAPVVRAGREGVSPTVAERRRLGGARRRGAGRGRVARSAGRWSR